MKKEKPDTQYVYHYFISLSNFAFKLSQVLTNASFDPLRHAPDTTYFFFGSFSCNITFMRAVYSTGTSSSAFFVSSSYLSVLSNVNFHLSFDVLIFSPPCSWINASRCMKILNPLLSPMFTSNKFWKFSGAGEKKWLSINSFSSLSFNALLSFLVG